MPAGNDTDRRHWRRSNSRALLVDFMRAHDHAMESKTLDDHRAPDALRMQLIEAYERLYQGEPLRSV